MIQMDKVSLSALTRRHLAAAHDAYSATTASFFSPSPNLFSGKANPSLPTNCPGSDANVRGADSPKPDFDDHLTSP
jgi:hypothetical protein